MPNQPQKPTPSSNTPRGRARQAAQDLLDQDQPITARSVREAARVSAEVAADVAREFNERQQKREAAPKPPQVVMARLKAVWADAYLAAQETWKTQKETLEAEVKTANQEIQTSAKAILETREQLAALQTRLTALNNANKDLTQQLNTATTERDVHQAQHAALAEAIAPLFADKEKLAEENKQLIKERDRLRQQLKEAGE